MKTATLQTIILLALFCFNLGNSVAQDNEGTTSFNEITGKVLDSRGKPVEKFSVTIIVYDYKEGGWNKQPKTVKKWEGEFENGEFQFDVDGPISFNEMTYIHSQVKAEGFIELGQNGSGFEQLGAFKGKFSAVKLVRAIKITGKVVLPDGQSDEELVDPKLQVAKKMSSFMPDYNKWFQASVSMNPDGSFEQLVPENCNLQLTASSGNAAALQKQFKIPKAESAEDVHDLGELKLKEGTRVSGVVLDRDSEPVEGQVVLIRQKINKNGYMQSYIDGHAVSDSEGKFELPPREGKCDISLVETAVVRKEVVKTKGDLLIAKPVSVTLKAGTPADDVEIRESKTWKIHGVVKYEKEKPSINFYNGSQSQNKILLGDDGSFEARVIDGAESSYLIIYGSSGSEIEMALLSRDSRKEFGKHFSTSLESETQYFQFKKVTSDIGPLEFRMVKYLPDERTMMEQIFDWYYFGE